MTVVISVLLWGLFIVGALPFSGQRLLEYRVPYWHPRLMGIASSLVELVCGRQLLCDALFRHELGVLAAGRAMLLGLAGSYLLLEGLLRLGITLKLEDRALPSLPVSVVWKAAAAILKKLR